MDVQSKYNRTDSIGIFRENFSSNRVNNSYTEREYEVQVKTEKWTCTKTWNYTFKYSWNNR